MTLISTTNVVNFSVLLDLENWLMCRGITSYLWLISAISRRLHSEQFNNQIYHKLQQTIFLSIYLHLVKNKITKSKLYALKYIIFLCLTSDLFFLGNFNSLKLAICQQPSIPLMSLVAFIVFLAGLLSGTRGKFGTVLHGETLTKINKLFLFYWNKDSARVITAISSILRLAWRKEVLIRLAKTFIFSLLNGTCGCNKVNRVFMRNSLTLKR